MRKSNRSSKIKILITIREDILKRLDNFVIECDNKELNRSTIIEDIISDFLKNKRKKDELFPED